MLWPGKELSALSAGRLEAVLDCGVVQDLLNSCGEGLGIEGWKIEGGLTEDLPIDRRVSGHRGKTACHALDHRVPEGFKERGKEEQVTGGIERVKSSGKESVYVV